MTTFIYATAEYLSMGMQLQRLASAGRYREAADCYRQMYLLPGNDIYMWWTVRGYCYLMNQGYCEPTEEDLSFMKIISKNSALKPEVCAEAGLLLGLLFWRLFRQVDSRKSYERVLRLNMPESHRLSKVYAPDAAPRGELYMTAGELFDNAVRLARENLTGAFSSTPTYYRDRSLKLEDLSALNAKGGLNCATAQQVNEAVGAYMELSVKAVGVECDVCHLKKTFAETETVTLQKCGTWKC